MSEMTRVTVAPGAQVKIPHPSGNPRMGGITLGPSESGYVPSCEVEGLWAGRKIMHPVTGAPPPPLPPPRVYRDVGPTISIAGSKPVPMNGDMVYGDWAATAEPPRSSPREIEAPPWDCTGGRSFARQRHDPFDLTGVCAPMYDAFGNPWPPR